MATNPYEFITTLFEKSRVLNDLNTDFLKELEFGELSVKQRIDLFYRSTLYHENIIQVIGEIVKSLDKTEVLLSTESKELLRIYDNLSDFTKAKVLKVIKGIAEAEFVPEHLTTCPKCGGILSHASDTHCKKIALRIGEQKFGYTYYCIHKEK